MVFHQKHTHGHAHGHEARVPDHLYERDSHGDQPKMHVPEGFESQQKQQDDNGQPTAVSVVYLTLSKTFSGAAVYSTLTGGPSPTSNGHLPGQTGKSGNGSDSSDTGESSSAAKASPKTSEKSGSEPTQSSVTNAVQTNSLDTAPARTTFATSTSSSGAGLVGSDVSTSPAPTLPAGTTLQGNSNANPSSQSSSGMSGGAAAGIALGLILGIALVAGALYYFYRRKTRLGKHEEALNEKHASLTNGAGTRNPETALRPVSVQSNRTSTAPRLSLRPVTQFAPLLNSNANKSNNSLNVANSSLAVNNKSQSSWERRPSTGQSANPREDPFADATIISEKQAQPESQPTNPFDQPERTSADSARQKSPSIAPAEIVAATTAAAVTSASNEKSQRPSSKSSVESSTPPTPASVKSTPAGPAVAGRPGAAGPPPGPRVPNNVHRVQLDFKPSMDDELELHSGQLVRLLHEYDDGWALCIRMDRSQQGVAPRTCLSKLPVKPRPSGPPPNGRPGPPQSRPGTPSGRPGTSHGPGPHNRPGTSHGPRGPPGPPGPRGPPSPPNGTMVPRPLTPSQANRDRSQSVTSGDGPSGVPPRKPVPGQAM